MAFDSIAVLPRYASSNERQDTRPGRALNALTAVLLIAQSLCILQLWSMVSSCTTTPTPQGATLIERRWQRDTTYMSLDHRYDDLWNETDYHVSSTALSRLAEESPAERESRDGHWHGPSSQHSLATLLALLERGKTPTYSKALKTPLLT
ncbi:uncharacterized protein PG986_000010 [Apiospora aurea]|uniref:Uncharacterized protein n=1 Tax=Apiospora aurea TaxID=335848 RepID=A0ABR1QTG5_9PEZI